MMIDTKIRENDYRDGTFHTYIPESFENAVLKHILLNNIVEKNSSFLPPLILGVQGPFGSGKTFMITELCKKYNIDLIQISSSEFSGSVEAASKEKFIKTYENACIKKAKMKKYTAILIDDFHLSIATEDDIGKTVNSNLLTSAIMNICDKPWISNYRIPIIFTGNNFNRIYSALIRIGRMDLFTWDPNEFEKTKIVKQIFSSKFYNIDDTIIEKLVKTYPNNSIAFFSQVSNEVLFSSFIEIIACFKNANGFIDNNVLRNKFENQLKTVSKQADNIFKIAEKENSKRAINYEEINHNSNIIKSDNNE